MMISLCSSFFSKNKDQVHCKNDCPLHLLFCADNGQTRQKNTLLDAVGSISSSPLFTRIGTKFFSLLSFKKSSQSSDYIFKIAGNGFVSGHKNRSPTDKFMKWIPIPLSGRIGEEKKKANKNLKSFKKHVPQYWCSNYICYYSFTGVFLMTMRIQRETARIIPYATDLHRQKKR